MTASARSIAHRGPRGPYRKTQAEKPYGFLATYEARISGRLVQKSFRAKCCESQARTKCLFRDGFLRVLRLEPLTQAEWEAAKS